jgi:hypothetical protein
MRSLRSPELARGVITAAPHGLPALSHPSAVPTLLDPQACLHQNDDVGVPSR